MATKTQDRELTIKWIMHDEKIVRFIELDEAVDMAESLAKLDFEKAGFVAGAKASVKLETINGKEVVTGMTLLKGAKSEAPKAEPQATQPEPETTQTDNVKVLTVGGYNIEHKGIIFNEEEKVWYDVDAEIGVENLAKMGIKKGSKVEITIEPPAPKKKNQRVVKIKLYEENKKAEPEKVKNEGSSKNDFANDNTTSDVVTEKDAFYRIKELERSLRYMKDNQQASIEAQGATERAFALVGIMVSKESVEMNIKNATEIKKLLNDYAEEAFKIIQKLKQPKV